MISWQGWFQQLTLEMLRVLLHEVTFDKDGATLSQEAMIDKIFAKPGMAAVETINCPLRLDHVLQEKVKILNEKERLMMDLVLHKNISRGLQYIAPRPRPDIATDVLTFAIFEDGLWSPRAQPRTPFRTNERLDQYGLRKRP